MGAGEGRVTAPTGDNPFVALLRRYGNDPVLFVREQWNITPDPWQAEVLEAYRQGERRLSIASGNGPGKTAVAAWISAHALCFKLPVKIVATAPSGPQMFDAFFAEVVLWIKRLNPILTSLFEIQSDRIELKSAPEESFLSARTSRAETPEALAGIHAERGWVILIADEASGVPEPVFQAASGSMAQKNAMTLLLGNPLRSSGLFFETHHEMKAFWHTWTVSSVDCPRVPPEWVEEMKARYGEESNAFRVQVLGQFPRADDDALIPIEWLMAARDRDIAQLSDTKEVWGVDVGGGKMGGDRSTLCKRRGKIIPEPIRVFKGYEPMQLVGALHAEYQSLPAARKPVEINVDAIGMGGPVAERLRELGLPARSINVSESPAAAKIYWRLRDELWYKARAWFEGRDVQIPGEDKTLVSELATIQVSKPTSSGLLTVETKDHLRKRIGRSGARSPDVADAFVLTMASDHIAYSGQMGAGLSWGKTLIRGIKGIV